MSCVFCMVHRTHSHLGPLMVGLYNRDGEGLLRGTECVCNKTVMYS